MPEASIYLGSGAEMPEIRDGEAALVLTSPPYFPDELEATLGGGELLPEILEAADAAIREFAFKLRPVFSECNRILRPHGVLVVQTRDVRLEDRLVAVEQVHRLLIESLGLVLYTRYLWRPRHTTRTRGRQLLAARGAGYPRAFDPEVFLVFKRPGEAPAGSPLPEDIERLASDIATTAVGRLRKRHRFQAPVPMLESIIRCWSREGDLVVDPFAGGGTTLVVARRLGRRSAGYEISEETFVQARENLEVTL